MDARALASPNLSVILAGNKADLLEEILLPSDDAPEDPLRTPSTSFGSSKSSQHRPHVFDAVGGSTRSLNGPGVGTRMTATAAPQGREVSVEEASDWATKSNIPVAFEVSALSGENVDDLFHRLARIILAKIELGEIDPDDPQSGIQYGDGAAWGFGTSDGGSIRSGMTIDDNNIQLPRRRGKQQGGTGTWVSGMREWEAVFRLSGTHHTKKNRCC
jgi:hypothetical protein